MKRAINLLFLSFFVLSVSAQDLAVIPKENYQITSLGPQLNDVALQGSTFFKTPEGRLLVYAVTRGKPAHLVGFDVSTQKIEVNLPLQGIDGSWDLAVSSTGIVYIAGGSGGLFYKHVPGSGTAENLGKVLGTENYVWDLSAGRNGEIYGATYPNCKIFKYHPDEGFTDFGNGPLVEGEQYVRSLAYNYTNQRIYGGIGTRAHLIEMDVNTKSKKSILPAEYSSSKFVYDMGQVEGLKSGDRIYFTGAAPQTMVYNVSKQQFEENIANFNVKTIIKDPKSEKVYYVNTRGGLMMLDYELSNPTPEKIGDFRGKPLASIWNDQGELLFLTSEQEIVTFNPTSKLISYSTPLDVPGQSIALTFIQMGPDSKIWSGAYLSGNNAAYDLKKNEAKVFRGLSQTESATVLGSKVYFGNYPGSRFNVYDTSREWNPDNKNPKLIGRVRGQDRPFGALAVPSLNRVFFGTVPDYGINGGALIEIDATTDKLYNRGEVVDKQSIISLAFQNDHLIGGGSIWGGLGIQPSESEAKLFVWDPLSRKKVFETVPVPGAKTITALFNGPDGLVWGYAQGTLFKLDVVNKKVVLTQPIYKDNRNKHLWRPDSFVVHSNGMIYGTLMGNLISLDPKTLEVKSFGIRGADLIMGLNGEMYYREGVHSKEVIRLDILKK